MVKLHDSSFFTVAFCLLKQTTSTPTSERAMKVRMTITTTAATPPLGKPGPPSPDDNCDKGKKGKQCVVGMRAQVADTESHCGLRSCSCIH